MEYAMKHFVKIIVILIFFFLSTIANSQNWVSQISGTTNVLYDVFFINNTTGWAVGQWGTILKTTNGGQSWVSQVSGASTTNLNSVYFHDANNGIIVGSIGTVLKTSDGGENWTLININPYANLYDIDVVSTNAAYAASNAENGICYGMWQTLDGGSTWQNLDAVAYFPYNAVLFPLFVGANGIVVQYLSPGEIDPKENATSNSLIDITSSSSYLVAVGMNGTIIISNGGEEWSVAGSGTSNDLTAVSFANGSLGFTVGENGTILQTFSGGDSWSAHDSGTLNDLLGVHYVDPGTAWAVGANGTILKFNGEPPLSPPNLLAPLDNDTDVETTVDLEWEAVEGATSYSLEVSTNPDFTELAFDEIDITVNYFTLIGLDYNKEYFWRVSASNGASFSDWSDVWAFTTEYATIALNAGWNTISSYAIPIDLSLGSIFEDIDNLVLVKNMAGQLYIPSMGINQIGNWNINEAYLVYTTSSDIIFITGEYIAPENHPINLVAGWNLVPYLRDNPMQIQTALANLSLYLQLVKNNMGYLYLPSWGINTIVNMQPGQGYWFYMTAPDILTYPAN